MNADRPALRALADRLGILAGYRDVDGCDRVTSDTTREALVASMGHDGSDESCAQRALSALDRRARERILEPVLVWREWADGSPELRVNTAALGAVCDYTIEVNLEDGGVEKSEGSLPSAHDGSASLPLPVRPPTGYHEIRLSVAGSDVEHCARQRLVMTPRTVLQPEEVLGERGAFGIWANLYSIRARADWGHGGLRELARLGRFAGGTGADFVGINPLHAVSNRGLDYSPYNPTSRLYRNVLYLDPEAVPELSTSRAARALLEDADLCRRRVALESATRIDHEAVLDLMLPVLRALHDSFTRGATLQRKAAYAAYREREGTPLCDFATWEILAEQHSNRGDRSGTDWRAWPERLRDPRGAAVEAFRDEHAEQIDFRCWLQFELDQQLADASRSVREAGCELGIYQDLALGSSDASADTWMAPEQFAHGAQVGCPPDAYAPEGQDWGFPPLDPHRLRDDGYRSWARLLGSAMAHSGALRIDHAMGMLRLFWIPAGRGAGEGAYVRYPIDDLLGIVALESRRAGAVVVAEDLGTLPPELPGLLADWGLLRSAVACFEQDDDHFRPASHYPPRALATFGTHDFPPLAGYFCATDLELRRRAGAFESEQAFAQARAQRGGLRDAFVAALRADGCLHDSAEPDDSALRDGAHAFLSATPSVLAGVSLDDLGGEHEPVNLPGLSVSAHPSWSRRMERSLEELEDCPEVRAALEPFRKRSGRSTSHGSS